MSDDNCVESISTNLPRLHGRWKADKHDKPEENGSPEVPFAEFAQHFWGNLNSVRERLAFLNSLNRTYRLQYLAIAEAIVTQIAAMCVEGPTHPNNYTIQALLKRQKKDHLIERIKKILDQVLCADCDGQKMTMAMCIKVLRNKFICHYDNFENYDIAGNEGVGEGKWTPEDREALFHVLFSCGSGPIPVLVDEVSKTLDIAAQLGAMEIVDGVERHALDSFSKDAEIVAGLSDTCVSERRNK